MRNSCSLLTLCVGFTLVVCFLSLPVPSRSGDPPRKPLKWGQADLVGIEKIQLFVYCDDKLPDHVFTTKRVENLVGSQLYKAGIKIVTEKEARNGSKGDSTKIVPTFTVTVGVTKTHEASLYCYLVEAHLDEFCRQYRGDGIVGLYPTWRWSGYGVVKPGSTAELKDEIHFDVQRFCTDFLAANPRK